MARHNEANRDLIVFRCTSRYLRLKLARESSSRARLAGVTISRLPDPLPGIPGAFEYRIVSTLIVGGNGATELADYRARPIEPPDQPTAVLHYYIDIFGFVAGVAEINLYGVGVPRPVSRKEEERLLVLLYTRTKEHHL